MPVRVLPLLLVSGRFVLAERDLGSPLRGSRNQRVHFLTGRYGPRDLESCPQAEVYLDADGGVRMTGFVPDQLFSTGGRGDNTT